MLGLVAISDPVKEDAKVAISGLKEAGLEPIIITGDNERTAHAIAKEVGVETVISQVLPQDKANKVRELQKQGFRVVIDRRWH